MNGLKMTKGFLAFILLLVTAVRSAQPVQAAPAQLLTYYFTGRITSISGTPFGLSPSLGQSVTGSITYDLGLASAYNTGAVAGYNQPSPSGMSVIISGVTIHSLNYNAFQVINNSFGFDNFNGFFTSILAGGVPNSGYVSFNLTDFTQVAFSSTALPMTLNTSSFSSRTGTVYGGGGLLSFSIDTLVMAVSINIKPDTFPNSINPQNNGVIPVAILTTNTFDATMVDAATVRFGRNGTEAAPVQSALEDVDQDGDVDMILQFSTPTAGIQCGDTQSNLTGKTNTGASIQGSDSIITVSCK